MSKGYYHTSKSVEEYISLAKDVNSSNIISKLKQVLPKGSTLLEIGSGPGTDYELLKEDYAVTGSDYSFEFLKRLQNKYPAGNFIHLNAANFSLKTGYDSLYANKVLQHLTNTELRYFIEKQVEIVNEKGIVCFTFWSGSGDENFKGMFVNYHQIADLKALFCPYFNILILEQYKEFEDGDSIVLIAQKKHT